MFTRSGNGWWGALALEALLIVSVGACGAAPERGAVPTAPLPATTATWLCHPERTGNACGIDATTTELMANGTRRVAQHPGVAPARAAVDCFYVYPTVDTTLTPGNHAIDGAAQAEMRATLAQAARLAEVCSVYVPRYRQVTLGTYLQDASVLEAGLSLGYSDVRAAFREYLAASGSRKLVLLGHSQGGEMIIRLLREFFDDASTMRERLLLAMVIGAEVHAPTGATTGGTFKTISLCTKPLETGCVVAYRTHAEGEHIEPERWAPPAGHITACVNPASLDNVGVATNLGTSAAPLSGAVFLVAPEVRRWLRGAEGITTPLLEVPDFYAARCADGPDGYRYLAVSPIHGNANETRAAPFDLFDKRIRLGKMGLHVLDMQFTQRDLIAMIARRIAITH